MLKMPEWTKGPNGKVGDAIEFLSDKQTEKGPSTGSIIDIEIDKPSGVHIGVTIKHSDHPGEYFSCSHLQIHNRIIREDGTSLWQYV